jgi:hypothetical protein
MFRMDFAVLPAQLKARKGAPDVMLVKVLF